MRKLAGIAILTLIIIAILLISPLIAGIYFERHYKKMLSFYNSSQQVHIEMDNYKRNWFNSEATIAIEVLNPQFQQSLEQMGVSSKELPKKYIIDQQIQHGPIIYRHLEGLPSVFGLAAIHNKLRLSSQINKLLQMLRVNPDLLQIGNDLITFNRNYFKHFKIISLNTHYPQSEIRVKLSKVEGNIWIWASKQRISGELTIHDLFVKDQQDSILIPSIKLQFDQPDGLRHFWVGNQSLEVSKMTWREFDKETFSISGINFSGFANDITGSLNGSRRIDINKVQINNQLLGPLHLQLTVNKLNTKAISDLIIAYQQILQRGELYQSQLQRKIYMMLPSIIKPGSTIKLDRLDINTPNGRFQMNGEFVWDVDVNNGSLSEDLFELLQAANGQINLRISKELMGKWIDFASSFALFNQALPELQNAYQAARLETYYKIEQNSFMILQLVQEKILPEKVAKALMILQKNMVSIDEYNEEIKRLLLDKKIQLWTSYYLSFLYNQAQSPLIAFEKLMKKNQKATQQGMQQQLMEWLKTGYIKQEKDDYIVSIMQGQNGITVNKKVLTN